MRLSQAKRLSRTRARAAAWAALLPLFAAGCAEGYAYRPLSLIDDPDCAQAPGRLGGFDYWLAGRFGPRVNWAGCAHPDAALAEADLSGATLTGVDLSGASLRDADLGGALADGANFSGADLSGANLVSTYLDGADLRGANLTGAELVWVQLDGAQLSGATWIDGTTVCAEGSVGVCKSPG